MSEEVLEERYLCCVLDGTSVRCAFHSGTDDLEGMTLILLIKRFVSVIYESCASLALDLITG